ncbi:hypothetical protein, partial [Alistipes putredinis]
MAGSIFGKSIDEEFPETGGSSLRFVRSGQTAGPVPGGFFGRTVLSSLFTDKRKGNLTIFDLVLDTPPRQKAKKNWFFIR